MSLFERLGIPGPKPNFIFGHLIDMKREGLNGVFPRWTKKYGPIVGFYIGGRPQVLTTDLEFIRKVMIKDFRMFSDRSQCIPGGIHPIPELQRTIAWAHVDLWRNLRASITPSFSTYKLNAMEPLMMTTINELLSELSKKSENDREFNIQPLLSEYMFSTSIKCIFGLNCSLNRSSREAKSISETIHTHLEKSILALVMILFPSLTMIAYPLRRLWEQFRFYMMWSPEGVTHNIAKRIVQMRRNAKSESLDFLQLLMNAKIVQSTSDTDLEMSSKDVKVNDDPLIKTVHLENLSEAQIVSNAMIFLLASNETTSVTLQFALHNLMTHQNIQEKLRDELRKAVGMNSKGIYEASSLTKVPLLRNVIKETLRMFAPGAPITCRVANENYEYQGITIPKGTPIYIGVASIHYDPYLWPEPEKFLPERFENGYDKIAYLPFGVG